MTLDLAVVAAVVLLALAGAAWGALRQLTFLGAAVLGFLAARALAPAVAGGLGGDLPAPVSRVAAALLVFFGVLFGVGFAAHLFLRWMGAGRLWRPADRALGALLGAAKAGLVAWVLLSALAFTGPLGPAWLDPKGSDFAALAREHNLFAAWRSPTADLLKRLLKAARDPRGSARLLSDVELRALLEDPRVQSLLEEARASGERDPALERSPRAMELLSDPAFLERLEKAQRKLDQAARR
ncbi:MAG TPA: CvpA family protein [Anaeromyxobacteraceae bacterium]|nr:CvpA family protein [Anaeromyxobacteraceae bacterium]